MSIIIYHSLSWILFGFAIKGYYFQITVVLLSYNNLFYNLITE